VKSQEKPQDWKIRQYYEQEEVIEKILEICQYREVAATYPQGYGKRPDAINFRGDLEQFIEQGAVALHTSVERWRNPLLIDNVSNLDSLRDSWDLVIDIDCDEDFTISKKTAKLVIQELESHGIENISVKFSGNRGFHIGVRGETFPQELQNKEFHEFYPELPRAIIDYLRNNLRKHLIQIIREHGYQEKMKTDQGLDPFQVADIENDWGQRHLFRAPYSLHDGSWLVSVPISKNKISQFEKKDAKIENVEFKKSFLDSYEEEESLNLAVQALDFKQKKDRQKNKEQLERSNKKDFDRPDEAIPEEYFPPTIKNILEGLEDGRKRALFILINFYRVVGYNWNEIESKIWEWNNENKEALRESYVKGQLRWHKNRDEDVPPPNYDSNGYYKDMNVYEGDNLEEKVANPVSYAFRKAKKRNNEEDEDDLVCPYCGKEYKRESYYKDHVQQCFE